MSFLLLTSATAGAEAPAAQPSTPEVLGGGGAWRSFQWPERRERKPVVRKRMPSVGVDARLVLPLPELAASVVVRNPTPVHVTAQLATPGLPAIHVRVRIVTPLELLEELEAILGVLDE